MTYEKQTWTNGTGGGTPLSAARLNHMEDGIEAAAEGMVLAVDYPGDVEGWPDRPTADDSVIVQWIGGDTSPPDAIPGVDFWVRPETIDDVLPGSTLTVYWDGEWPARPTSRNDVTVMWIGGTTEDLPPSTNEVDLWVRDAV